MVRPIEFVGEHLASEPPKPLRRGGVQPLPCLVRLQQCDERGVDRHQARRGTSLRCRVDRFAIDGDASTYDLKRGASEVDRLPAEPGHLAAA